MENPNSLSTENSIRHQRLPNILLITLAGLATALAAVFIFKAAASTVFAVGIVILVTFLYIYTHPKQSFHNVKVVDSGIPAIDHSDTSEVDPAFLRSNGCH